ncbi:type VI secretion system-associated FHA domain protein TagH [Sphingomonas montana]|uniref:type VI secretion system-associated FHA domain protein TagH n=1 Tax=Sphingomonas montana TaxID=1843236 RepID=UPI00096EAADA|nr:type VI secretion system-associated FHA domain protein TagH [Sphingomonas montana]
MRLRLFHKDDLTNQIDSRALDEGQLSIGRDARADWSVADPERGISRTHLTIVHAAGRTTVRDTSSNGVFLGEPRQRLERDRPVPVGPGDVIRFGPFVLLLEDSRASAASAAPAPILPEPGRSPFGAPEGLDPPRGESTPRRLDPFASAMRPDPLVDAHRQPQDGVDADAWERRPDRDADGWNAGTGSRRADPPVIGTERAWTAPPAEARDPGYGFDAPFSSPILHAPAVPAAATQIPSDWALADAVIPPEADPVHMAPVAPVTPVAAPIEVAPPPVPVEPLVPPGLSMPMPGPDRIPPDVDLADGAAPAAPPRPAPPEMPPGPSFVAAPAMPPTTAAAPQHPAARGPAADDALFDAFCAGAGLSPTSFVNEDRAALMHRLGTIYRQAILGLADVMGERTALKDEYRMSRTQVRAEGNNPFKWVPPQRIAIDLLRTEDSGYTTGAAALNEAFHDVKAHLLCMLAGMRAALGATFDALGPDEIERRLASRNYLIRTQRDAAAWIEYADRYAEIRREADSSSEGIINAAFRSAYERQLEEIRVYGARR